MGKNHKEETVTVADRRKQLEKRLKHILRLGWLDHGTWGEVARIKEELERMEKTDAKSR